MPTHARLLGAIATVFVALAGCPSDPNDEDGSPTTTMSDAETDTGGAQTCAAPGDCGPEAWCDFPDDACGAGLPGTCEVLPAGCSGTLEIRECGCDGETYERGCASLGGVDINVDASSCTAPPGYFPCGDVLCQADFFYCEAQISDVAEEPSSFVCTELPAACGQTPSCDCLVDQPCGDICGATGDGFTLTCPGG